MSLTIPAAHAPEQIETEHLILKKSVDDRDKADLCAHIKAGGRDEFVRWSGIVTPDSGADEFIESELRSFSLEHDDESFTKIAYTIFPKATGKMAGYVSLDLLEAGDVEFEAYVFEEDRKEGVGEEASRALIADYFDGTLVDDPLDSITTWSGSFNVASHQLITALGFEGPAIDEEDLELDDDDPVGALSKYTLTSAKFNGLSGTTECAL